MNKLATLLSISLALLLLPPTAQAWSGAGHQVIAAEAYRQLTPALKAKVAEILKAHPDYEKWKESFAGDSATLNLDMFIFMRASFSEENIGTKSHKQQRQLATQNMNNQNQTQSSVSEQAVLAAALALAGVWLVGCHTMVYQQGDRAAGSAQAAAMEVQNQSQRLEATMTTLTNLVDKPADDLNRSSRYSVPPWIDWSQPPNGAE